MQKSEEFEVFSKTGTSGCLTLIVKKKTLPQTSEASPKDPIVLETTQLQNIKSEKTLMKVTSFPHIRKRRRPRRKFFTKKKCVPIAPKVALPFCETVSSEPLIRPNVSYEELIRMALKDAQEKQKRMSLRVCEIANWIRKKFPYFCTLKHLSQCVTFRLIASSSFQKHHDMGRTLWYCIYMKPPKSPEKVSRRTKQKSIVHPNKVSPKIHAASSRLPRIRKKPDFFSVRWESSRPKRSHNLNQFLKPRTKQSITPKSREEEKDLKSHLEYLQNAHAVVKPLTPDTGCSSQKSMSNRRMARKIVRDLTHYNLEQREAASSSATRGDEFVKRCTLAYLGLVPAVFVSPDGIKPSDVKREPIRHNGPSRRSLAYEEEEGSGQDFAQTSRRSFLLNPTKIHSIQPKPISTYWPPKLDSVETSSVETTDEDSQVSTRNVITSEESSCNAKEQSSSFHSKHSIPRPTIMLRKVKLETPKHSPSVLHRCDQNSTSPCTRSKTRAARNMYIKQEKPDENTVPMFYSNKLPTSKKKTPQPIIERREIREEPLETDSYFESPQMPRIESVFTLRKHTSSSKKKSTTPQRLQPESQSPMMMRDQIPHHLHMSSPVSQPQQSYSLPKTITFPLQEYVQPAFIPEPFLQQHPPLKAFTAKLESYSQAFTEAKLNQQTLQPFNVTLESFSEPTWTRDVKKSVMTPVVPAYCYFYPVPVMEHVQPSADNPSYCEFPGHRVFIPQLFRRVPYCDANDT